MMADITPYRKEADEAPLVLTVEEAMALLRKQCSKADRLLAGPRYKALLAAVTAAIIDATNTDLSQFDGELYVGKPEVVYQGDCYSDWTEVMRVLNRSGDLPDGIVLWTCDVINNEAPYFSAWVT